MITYNTIDVDMPALPQHETSAWVRAVAESYGKRVGEVAYVFCNDEKILEVNRQFLQHDYFTDIITFDYTEGQRIGGDLFISLDTVRSNGPTTRNSTAWSSTASCTSAASTTRGRANAS